MFRYSILTRDRFVPALVAVIAFLSFAPHGFTEPPTRVQTLSLAKGWNAVWLEVDPLENDPARLFEALPVDRVARRFTPVTNAQFIADPESEAWNTTVWGIWYREDPDRAFLSTLHRIQGREAYLIRAERAATWRIEGTIPSAKRRWQAGAFNLMGFPIDPDTPPDFTTFFGPTNGGIGERIYRLIDGKWQSVNPSGTARMRSGEACWISCSSHVHYDGPVDITTPSVDGLDFLDVRERGSVEARNRSDQPCTITVTSVAPRSGSPLVLHRIARDLSTSIQSYPPLPASYASPVLRSGESWSLDLLLRREKMTAPSQSLLLQLTTSLGSVHWIPIQALAAAQP